MTLGTRSSSGDNTRFAALKALDLGATPFSRRGSYFAVSRLASATRDGVFLRTVRGDARNREIVRLDLGTDVATTVRPGALSLVGTDGATEVALDGADRAIVRVDRGTLDLAFQTESEWDAVLPERDGAWRFVDSGANRNYRFSVVGGSAVLDATWDGVRNRDAVLHVTAGATVEVREYGSAVDTTVSTDFPAVESAAASDFAAWASVHATDADGASLGPTAELAAFVTWGALVPAGGLLRRESMLMSKNWMTSVWSWDHCFNAIGLHHDPAAAADQLCTIFDHQDEHGCLPDFVNDAGIERNFVKPPVHGWAIGWLMDRGALADDVVAGLYEPLGRWTDWWFAHRDYVGDGIPAYNHGNDSGWDNSTAFADGVPLQSPDLLAFLVLQMHVLARIADGHGLHDAARSWRRRADETRDRMLAEFWRDGRFVARNAVTRRIVDSDSLLMLMPLVLGEYLPDAHFRTTVDRLLHGGFLTPFGVASESIGSPRYAADGYWRGPVWAPTVMLLADGLERGGEPELAGRIRDGFSAACDTGGMAENFDALTGQGLRDRSLTWTASVYLAVQRHTASPVSSTASRRTGATTA